ncbi:MAG: hypothetical protein E7666_03085 [Ruminococcaceae bacterium]|nr:hypothetical protein [Oscillospiraceae bacterium]
MRKSICFLAVFLLLNVCFLFSSCTYTVFEDGIENFSREDSETGLTRFLIPNDFLNLFPYLDGDYSYFDELSYSGAYETALIYMKYEEDAYESAKAYALENMRFIENTEEIYNGYVFQQRELPSDMQQETRCFFAYSDEQRILLAVGTHITVPEGYTYTSIETFLDTYFSFYNFEEGRIERETKTESQLVESLTQ